MKRKPTPSRRNDRESSPQVCAADLRGQLERIDGGRTVRRGDHPRNAVRRIDLLADADLDAFRSRHGELADAALARFDVLDDVMSAELARAGLNEETLEQCAEVRPLLALFVCAACGASDVALTSRSWPVDRAMRRTGMAERDLLAIEDLLLRAWQDFAPALDSFSLDGLAEMRDACRRGVNLDAVRARTVELLGPDGEYLVDVLRLVETDGSRRVRTGHG